MAPGVSGSWVLHEAALLSSYLPIALYALGLRVQDALVSAICDKPAAPAAFTGGINDFKSIWSMKQSELFGTLGPNPPCQVVSLRHGNSFPLVNKAILAAAGCIGRQPPVKTDLTMPRSVSVNVTFIIPEKMPSKTYLPAKLIGGLIGCLEICALVCSGTFLGLHGIYAGSALAACLAITSLCYLILQQLEEPVYAHKDAIKKDLRLTTGNGAATDIHVVVPDWNSHEMDVLVGYSSQLHSLTNMPARVSRPYLLQWACRVLGVVLVVQATLLAKLVRAPVPELYGSPIWLLSYLAINAIQAVVARKFSSVKIGNEPVALASAPQVVLPSRRAALAFISSLPSTPPKVDRWDWTDSFMPRNARREAWQQEVDIAQLGQEREAKVNLSDDGRRIVTQVRGVRFEKELLKSIGKYEAAVGMNCAKK